MEETLGKRIASNRKSLGLTQDALAEQLGVTAQAVSKWENDQSCPDISMLPRLAAIFGCSVDALLGLSTASPVRPEAEDSDMDVVDRDHLWEIKWELGKKRSIAVALWILLLGSYLAAGVYFHWPLSSWAAVFHSGLVAFGLMGFVSGFSAFRIICFVAGVYWMAEGTGILEPYFNQTRSYVFPLILILLGIQLLITGIRKNNKPLFSLCYNGKPFGVASRTCTYEENAFRCETRFGENHHMIDLPLLEGGQASVSFGELEIDLRGCGVIADGCSIELDSSFGELRVLVPKNCRIRSNISTAFAEVSVDGEPEQNANAQIYVNGRASFGHIELEYR